MIVTTLVIILSGIIEIILHDKNFRILYWIRGPLIVVVMTANISYIIIHPTQLSTLLLAIAMTLAGCYYWYRDWRQLLTKTPK